MQSELQASKNTSLRLHNFAVSFSFEFRDVLPLSSNKKISRILIRSLCSIWSDVPILNVATGERGGGRGHFTPAGGGIISITGSAFGPSGIDAKFAVQVRPSAGTLGQREGLMEFECDAVMR